MDGSFVAQRESRFRLHCAIRVQNHQLFPGGNSWQFIVKIRGGQVLGVRLAMQPFFYILLLATRVYFVIELARATKYYK